MKTIGQVLLEYVPEIEDVGEATLHKAGKRGVELAQETNLFRTSQSFKDAITFTPVSSTNGFVLADKPYAPFLEYGNNEHGAFIYPVHGKALHFFINGTEVFAKKVKSHGPLPFMEQAANQLEQELPGIFEEEFDKIIKE